MRGGLFGYGLDHEITDAYEWLIDHYNEGDQLFGPRLQPGSLYR
ncbi:hypothetical protein MES5069_800018 [Mesorhizobium escarrei]|uniref:Uncharacterized protein n=1 Tax=Mesorhizobium escarrei TaxID=666018 RepID=A0ABN8KI57_9HYPH|nr:DUF2235 domain-containing protein [Mesorhizobium escarrei]CAH2409339.1 hypothetical protein MES5069_800018 [Mesorhizobium escarrei]